MTRSILTVLLALSVFLHGAESGKKPNIVLLYSDDAGYADFGFHGSPHFKTPNLDKLAASGVRMSCFYMSSSVCGPSRAGMLTGRYQQRFGFEENNVPGIMSPNGKQTGHDMGLPADVPTVGNYLQELGYKTAIFGKWHLGEADRYNPTKRGFDEFFGFRGGARSFFAYPKNKTPDLGRRLERNFGEFREHEGYLTDALADAACDFMERHQDEPFFAYVSFNAVHVPMEADPEFKDEFSQLKGTRRTCAQMAVSMDKACGQIIAKLKELGLYEDTLIVYTNDNGGPPSKNGSSNHPFAGSKGTHLEGGIRVPGIFCWPGRLPEGVVYDHPAIALDLIPTFIAAGGGSEADGLDGVDLVPYLKGDNKNRPHQSLYWKKETRGTVRDGDWKLMRYPDRPAELYHLVDDPSEQNDLAAEHPDKVRELFKKLFEWEITLQRPLFMLRPKEEKWSADRVDDYRKPPAADF